jgi:hypothetical protein
MRLMSTLIVRLYLVNHRSRCRVLAGSLALVEQQQQGQQTRASAAVKQRQAPAPSCQIPWLLLPVPYGTGRPLDQIVTPK